MGQSNRRVGRIYVLHALTQVWSTAAHMVPPSLPGIIPKCRATRNPGILWDIASASSKNKRSYHFPKWLYYILHQHQNFMWVIKFLLSQNEVLLFSYFSHSERCAIVTHCDFSLFSNEQCWTYFCMLILHVNILLMDLVSFAYFHIRCLFFAIKFWELFIYVYIYVCICLYIYTLQTLDFVKI